MSRLTVASFDSPTWLRRRWHGARTAREVVDLIAEYVSRSLSGEIFWR